MEKAQIFIPLCFEVVGVNASRGAATCGCGSGVCTGKQKLGSALIGIKFLICPRRTWYPAKPYPNTASGSMSGL